MDAATALFMGLLQGITELFPISSLGHAVVVPPLLHLGVRQSDDSFVPFLVLLHLGTGLALLALYRDTWWRIVQGFVRAALRGRIETADERLAMLLVVGTIPTGLIGFIFEKSFKSLFATPRVAAVFLILNAVVLLTAEAFRRADERRRAMGPDRRSQEAGYAGVEQLSVLRALAVGACQALALLPGISRAGSTMAAGLVVGLSHQEAARFSFLLATPIILAAGVFEIGDLFGTGVPLGSYLAAAAVAGVAAYLSARFLLRYFQVGRLDPYAWYCAALGLVALILLAR